MILFLMLLIPLSFFVYIRVNRADSWGRACFIAFSGFFAAAFFCAFRYFFIPPYFLPQASFFADFMYYFIGQSFLPLLVVTFGLYFATSRNEVSDFFENLFPVYAGFFAVMIPFRVIVSDIPYPFFQLFTKPLVYLAMIFVVPPALKEFYHAKKDGVRDAKRFAVNAAVFILAITLPAVCEALWVTGASFLILFLCSIIQFALPFAWNFYNKFLQ